MFIGAHIYDVGLVWSLVIICNNSTNRAHLTYIETPFELKQCSSVNDLNSYLKTKGVSASTGEPSRLSIERHKTLHGSSGRQGRNHLEQIRDGMSEFYSQIVSGLRSVEVMPAQYKVSPETTCTEDICVIDGENDLS